MKNQLSPIANGNVLPYQYYKDKRDREREAKLLKRQFRHDWMIAIFGVVGGAVAGFVTSLIFMLLTS